MRRVGVPGLFSVEIPASWEAWEAEGSGASSVRFHTGLPAHLEVTPLSALRAGSPPPLELLREASEGSAGAVLELRPLELPCRLPAARVVRAGRDGGVVHFALVLGPQVTLVLSLSCAREDARELVPQLLHMLASLRVGDAALELASEVAAAVRTAAPSLEVEVADDDLLLVRAPGRPAEAQVGLTGLRAELAREPARRAELIAARVARITHSQGRLDLPPVLPSTIYPRLVPRERLDQAIAAVPVGEDPPLAQAWGPDAALVVALVTTTFDGFRWVGRRDLAELGLTPEQAGTQACANLEAWLRTRPPAMLSRPDGRVWEVVLDHPHAAACLLLPSLLRELEELLGAGLHCWAPAEGALFAHRAGDRRLDAVMRARARARFAVDRTRVTPRGFTIRGGAVQEARSRRWWWPW